MTSSASGVRRTVDGAARLTTVFVSFGLAVTLAVGPIIWALGTLNGDEVTFDGGAVRLVGQLLLVGLFARIASRRATGSPCRVESWEKATTRPSDSRPSS